MKKNNSALTLYSLEHKNEFPFEKRYYENKRLREKFPNDIPIIVFVVVPKQKKETYKLLIPSETNGDKLIELISSEIGYDMSSSSPTVEKRQQVFQIHNTDFTMEEFYREYKDSDGFVYITVCTS
jgi:hypothetical protein